MNDYTYLTPLAISSAILTILYVIVIVLVYVYSNKGLDDIQHFPPMGAKIMDSINIGTNNVWFSKLFGK